MTPRKHAKTCRFWLSIHGAVGIECEHGYDSCPKCDPCTCPPQEGDDDTNPSKAAK